MSLKSLLLLSVFTISSFWTSILCQSNQKTSQGDSLFIVADDLLSEGKLMPASKIFNQSLNAFLAIDDQLGILRAKTKQANIEGSLGNFKASNNMINDLLLEFESRYFDSLIIGQLYLAKGKNLRNIGELDQAEDWIRKSMSNMKSNQSMQDYCKAHLYLGIVKWDKNEDGIEAYLLESLALFKKHFTQETEMLGHPHHLLGVYKLHFGNLKLAKEHFNKAVKYLEKGNDNLAKGNGIFYLGIIDWNEKNYEVALEHMEKAKQIFNSTYGPGHVRTTFVDNLIGNVHTDLGNHILAEKYFEAAYAVRKIKYGPTHVETIAMLMNKSNAQLNQGNYTVALKSLKEAAHLFEQAEKKTYDYFKVYKNIGSTYAKMGKYDKARQAFEIAAKNGKQVLLPDAIQWIDLRMEQVLLAGSKEEAMVHFDQAYQIFELEETISEIPSNKFQDIIHPIYLFQILVEKLSYLREHHEKGNDLSEIDGTVQLMHKGLELANFIRLDLENDGSRAQFFSLAKRLFHNYLDIAWMDRERNQESAISNADIHSIMEKSKAWILLEGLKDRRSTSELQLQDTFKIQIKNLNKQIDERYQLITQIEETDFNKLNQVRSEIYDLKQKLLGLESEIQIDIPSYKVPSAVQEITSQALSSYVENKDALFIHYAITPQYVYVFGFNGFESFFKRQKKEDTFEAEVFDLYKNLKTKGQDQLEYNKLISSLSKQLIYPIESLLPASESLIIVPDGLLHYLPFDILKTTYQDQSLIYAHNISYAYSGTILMELDIPKSESRNDFLAMAPEFLGSGQMAMRGETTNDVRIIRADLPALQGANDEVNSINSIFNGTVLTSAEATENNFKEKANHHGIVHLATHAIIDDENPINSYLALSEEIDGEEDGNLYLWELKNLDLQTQMTVLSACNTGYGKLQEGEGMISLGRAFLLAGSQSVVMSSWPAQDFSTKKIMINFYENLSKGQTKDQALRQAKLNYLSTADENMNHPFYWSGFSINGLNDPIQFSSNLKFPTIFLGVLGIIAIASLLFFKIKSK